MGNSEIVSDDLDVMLSKLGSSGEAFVSSLGLDEVRSSEESSDFESIELEGTAVITSGKTKSSIGTAVFSRKHFIRLISRGINELCIIRDAIKQRAKLKDFASLRRDGCDG